MLQSYSSISRNCVVNGNMFYDAGPNGRDHTASDDELKMEQPLNLDKSQDNNIGCPSIIVYLGPDAGKMFTVEGAA